MIKLQENTIMEMNLLRLLTVAAFFVAAMTNGNAQNIESDTIQWNSTNFVDLLADNTAVAVPCQFITKGISSLEWVQANGSYICTMQITSKDGSWTDLNNDGSITYNVTLDQIPGRVTLSRSGNSLKLLLDLNGASHIKNEYTISGFELK